MNGMIGAMTAPFLFFMFTSGTPTASPFTVETPTTAGIVHGATGVVHGTRSIDELALSLEQADRLYERNRFDEARRLLEQLLRKHSTDAGVLWRLANHAINDGDAETNETKQEKLYRKAVAFAERAVKAEADNAWAHAYLAAASGSYAMYAGGEEKVKLANRIRDELDIALKLDPENQVAHTIYGTWHREVADVSWIERKLANIFLGGLPDGSFEQSVWHLKKAIAIAPTVLRHRFELGKTYMAMDRERDAAESFRAAQKCPDGWKIDPRRREFMREWLRDNG